MVCVLMPNEPVTSRRRSSNRDVLGILNPVDFIRRFMIPSGGNDRIDSPPRSPEAPSLFNITRLYDALTQ